MNKLSTEKRVQILSALVEGNSLRSTTRMTGCSINTVTKLLIDVGTACDRYQNETIRNLRCERIQCDEIWAFCYSKQKNVPPDKEGVLGYGDLWTWVGMGGLSHLFVRSALVGLRQIRLRRAQQPR